MKWWPSFVMETKYRASISINLTFSLYGIDCYILYVYSINLLIHLVGNLRFSVINYLFFHRDRYRAFNDFSKFDIIHKHSISKWNSQTPGIPECLIHAIWNLKWYLSWPLKKWSSEDKLIVCLINSMTVQATMFRINLSLCLDIENTGLSLQNLKTSLLKWNWSIRGHY